MAEPKWTPRHASALKAMYAAGDTEDAIAAALGVARSLVNKYRLRLGLSRPRVKPARAGAFGPWTPDREAVFDLMHRDGHSDRQIARALGCRRQAVSRRRAALGLPPVDPAARLNKPRKDGRSRRRVAADRLDAAAGWVLGEGGLCRRLARRWSRRNPAADPDDLYAAAALGLVRAAARFDPARGRRFGAYARRFAEREVRELCRREAARGFAVPQSAGFVNVRVVSLSGLGMAV